MFMKLIFNSGSNIPFIFICLSICPGYMLISGGGASAKSSCGRVPSRSWSDSKNDMYNDFSLFTVIQHQIQNLMYNVKFSFNKTHIRTTALKFDKVLLVNSIAYLHKHQPVFRGPVTFPWTFLPIPPPK